MTDAELCQLLEKLNTLAQAAEATRGWGRKRWNREVKQVLVQMGADRGYRTCASGVPAGVPVDYGEWLYDVVWLQADPGFRVREVNVVAEIEWGNRGEVWDDYQKLHVPDSRTMRLLICDNHPRLLEDCLRQIRDRGGTYVFILYHWPERRFHLHVRRAGTACRELTCPKLGSAQAK